MSDYVNCDWKSDPGNIGSTKLTSNFHSKNKIQQKFSLINKNIQAKTEVQISCASQLTHQKQKINRLEEKMAQTFRKMAQDCQATKDRLRIISFKVNQIGALLKERRQKNMSRIASLKNQIELSLKAHQYLSEVTLKDLEQQYTRAMANIAKNKQKQSHPQLVSRQKNILSQLKDEASEMRQQFSLKEKAHQHMLEKLLTQFGEKAHEWKHKLSLAESDHKELLKKLRKHVEDAKQEIERQLFQERKTRQENKQKLLALFEGNLDPFSKQKVN